MHPRISIRGYVRPLVRRLVRRSVGRSIGPSLTRFFLLSKNGGKWLKRTFHISAGFLFQPFALNLSFNLPFIIFLSQSFFQNQTFFHNLNVTIFPTQSSFHNLSCTTIPSNSFFHNL